MVRLKLRSTLKIFLILILFSVLGRYLYSSQSIYPTQAFVAQLNLIRTSTVFTYHGKDDSIVITGSSSLRTSSSDLIDWHNYTQIEEESRRIGPGEQGSGITVSKSEEKEQERIYRENGFNGYVSDKMSLQRSLRDIRHSDCRNKTYLRNLLTVSVIIPFHQEHWSTLLRTVDSVIRRSPEGLIREVLLVDDASRKPFLQKPLDNYLQDHYPIARVIRSKERQGLIRTRILGAREATGDVLIFLDSHTEANINWLPPLVDPIARDYKTVTCPIIDSIDEDTFEYKSQDEGGRGVFNWFFLYKRLPRLESDAYHPSDPFESPVMAGGLFSISRKWFWEIGGYDEGLDIWGGEQYEISFKIWQCGGRMFEIPCSRIGHVYRKYSPFPNNARRDFVLRNFKRVAEVWMDEYKEYLYMRYPSMRNEDVRDLENQIAIRQKLSCKPFSWYMENVAFDIIKTFPLVEPNPLCSGELQLQSSNLSNSLCIDFRFGGTGYVVGLSPCLSVMHKGGGEQNLIYSWRGEIRVESRDSCLDCSDHHPGASLLLFTCHGKKGNQLFKINSETKQIIFAATGNCLEGNSKSKQISVEVCNPLNGDQKWSWTKENKEEVDKVFKL